MMRFIPLLACLLLLTAPAQAAEPSSANVKELVDNAAPVPLPEGIVWETDNDEPFIGSPDAVRGGTINIATSQYPLTLRIVGPNSNEGFALWKRMFAMQSPFGLVIMHPTTDKYIPILATHWSVQPDQKTIYFKLDPDAKFSDGHPVTAEDYVFTWRMMQSKFIVDPFQNTYAEQYIESVDKVDDYTLRVVGKNPSWRPLSDYAGLWPTPAHTTVLDDTWVERTTNEIPVVPGPYVISDMKRGESITFKRVPNWWGDKKRYFTGMFNFDEIHLTVIQPERELDFLRQGRVDIMWESSARNWAESYNFPAVQNGWLRRSLVFVQNPSGVYGMQLNLQAPIFQNRDFRIAMEYLFNFERLNRNVMYDAYYRQRSFFSGTPFANPALAPYTFDPAKARELLAKAGYHRPEEAESRGMWIKMRNAVRGLIFTRTDSDDILVHAQGEKASFTVQYAQKSFERHLTVIQQDYRRAGIDMRLQLLEGGTNFERLLERKYEAAIVGMSSSFYPSPREYLHSAYKKTTNNNNFWAYGSDEVDKLIEVYEKNLNSDERIAAMHRIDEIVREEGLYIPFWDAPYHRLVYWDYIQFPEFYLPKRTDQYLDWLVFWIDPAKKAALEEAMKAGKAYPLDAAVEKDPYDVRKNLQ